MIQVSDVKMETSWKKQLEEEFSKNYFAEIKQFLVSEKQTGKKIYPPSSLIFRAFDIVPFNEVKVVIIGQDPYHKPGEAHGLSFSVPKGVKVPPSLKKIYKELGTDIDGFTPPSHGNLEHWANQGVFLLNAFLTVEERKPKSHQKIGWENFTDAVITKLSQEREGIVFMLWGAFAKKKASLIDKTKHLILNAAHPSPLAGNKFLNCKHFSQANTYLEEQGNTSIDWHLSE